MSRSVVVYTDGAARGNPGPAGAGAVVLDLEGETLDEAYLYLGRATNNVAEYRALLLGLERAQTLHASSVEVRADSELLVRQMRGEYRVRNAGLKPLHSRAQQLVASFEHVEFVHVRREHNRVADRLANRAIDASGSDSTLQNQ